MSTTRRSTLPAGRADASSIPRHMVNENQNSSFDDSTGSNDSFQSQAALPFHMAEDNDYPPRTPYKQNGARPRYQTETSTSTDSEEQKSSISSRSLNPHSRVYIPTDQSPFPRQAFNSQLPNGLLYRGFEKSQNFHGPREYATKDGYANGHHVEVYQGTVVTSNQPGFNLVLDPYAHYGVPNSMGTYSNGVIPHNGYAPAYNGRGSITNNSEVATPSDSSFGSRRYSSDEQSAGGTSSAHSSGRGGDSNGPYQYKILDENRFRSQPPPATVNVKDDMTSQNRNSEHRLHSDKTYNDDGTDRYQVGSDASDKRSKSTFADQENPVPPSQNSASPYNRGMLLNDRDLTRCSSPGAVLESDINGEGGTLRSENKRDDSADSKNRTPQRPGRQLQTFTEKGVQLSNLSDQVTATSTEARQEIADRLLEPLKTQKDLVRVGREHFGNPARSVYHSPLNIPLSSSTTVRATNLWANDGHSTQYKLLTDNGSRKPTIEEALLPSNLPFVEYCRLATLDEAGVIKIRNIPYNVSRQEIMAFLGRNARLVSENAHEPIHIVMERVTSKTLDCYVEFINFNEAVNAVQRFEGNRIGGKGSRLGQRHVDIELSSQEQLMKDLFPKAKNVKWCGSRPEIIPRDFNDKYNSGFAGFLSKEEMVMLVKHVEAPQRSPFSKECPQRPFECLISTLLKYPWHAVEHITIQDRNLLHEATKQLVRMLHHRVHNQDPERKESIHINNMLLKRVWRAVLACPGLTPTMKDDIVVICELDEDYCREYGLAPRADEWRYLWTIGPKAGVQLDVLEYYIALIRDFTLRGRRQLSLAEQAAQGGGAPTVDFKLFGDLDKFIEYPPELAHRTLAQVAHVEWTAIEQILRRTLTPALCG